MLPAEIRVILCGKRPKIAKFATDLPEPDSPTIPNISLVFRSKEISVSTGLTWLSFVKPRLRFLTERSMGLFWFNVKGLQYKFRIQT